MFTLLRRFIDPAICTPLFLFVAMCCSHLDATAQTPSARNPYFSVAAPLPGGTAAHSATVLANGNVLVVGGYGELFGRIPVATNLARIYDSTQQKWRVARGRLTYGRLRHGAIRLNSGRVLIVGGTGQDKKPMRSCELYDPCADTFQVVANMAQPRSKPRLNLLPHGGVLITGQSRTVEIFESSASAATGYVVRPAASKCHFRHDEHAAVSLNDGSVLLIAGRSRQLELFDPDTESFHRLKAHLPTVVDDQAVALLYDGSVLLAGGQEVYGSRAISQTWIYDPVADSLTAGPQFVATAANVYLPGAADMVAVDLFAHDPADRGRYIILAGGEYDPGRKNGPDITLDSACVFDAANRRLIDVGPMRYTHDDFAAVSLPAPSGQARVLIIAGHGTDDSFQPNCEIFAWRP